EFITQFGLVDSRFLSWETTAYPEENPRSCHLCDKQSNILFEYRVIYDYGDHLTSIDPPRVIDLDLCNECSERALDNVLKCINYEDGYTYLKSFLTSAIYKKPTARIFTSFQSLHSPRSSHDVEALYKGQKRSAQNQFISANLNETITIDM